MGLLGTSQTRKDTHTNPKLRIPFGYFDGDPTTSENFPWEIDAGGDRVSERTRARGDRPE